MPVYNNPYLYGNAPGVGAAYFNPYPQQPLMYGASAYGNPGGNYWISVDGEMAARAWQMPANLPPNTIIPLWDLDGQHVYFKSVDAYGRINPIRKGRVVFEDETQRLDAGASETYAQPQNMSESCAPVPVGDSRAQQYVTKEDFDGLRHEIQDMLRSQREMAQASVNAISEQPAQNGQQNSQQNGGYNQNSQNNQNGNKRRG